MASLSRSNVHSWNCDTRQIPDDRNHSPVGGSRLTRLAACSRSTCLTWCFKSRCLVGSFGIPSLTPDFGNRRLAPNFQISHLTPNFGKRYHISLLFLNLIGSACASINDDHILLHGQHGQEGIYWILSGNLNIIYFWGIDQVKLGHGRNVLWVSGLVSVRCLEHELARPRTGRSRENRAELRISI